MKKISEERHPNLEQIRRFVRGEASPSENRKLVRHLLHGCSECQKVVRQYWSEEASAAARSCSKHRALQGGICVMKKSPMRKLSLSKETVLSLDQLREVQGAAYRPSADAYCWWATIWTQGCAVQV